MHYGILLAKKDIAINLCAYGFLAGFKRATPMGALIAELLDRLKAG